MNAWNIMMEKYAAKSLVMRGIKKLPGIGTLADGVDAAMGTHSALKKKNSGVNKRFNSLKMPEMPEMPSA